MSVSIEALKPSHFEKLRAFLQADVAHHVYLLGLLEEFGIVPGPGKPPFAFWARLDHDDITSVVFVGGSGGLVVPSSSAAGYVADVARALSTKVRLLSALGESTLVDTLVQNLGGGVEPRLVKTQRLLSVSADDLGPFTNPTLRLATEDDAAALVALAAGAVRETQARDPLQEDPVGFPLRVKQRIRAKRTYVLPVEKSLVFKLDIGARSSHGAELEGFFTAPDQRRRGHFILSLGQISRHLLSSLPRLHLRVNEADAGLIAAARKVGYVPGRAQKLVVM